MNATENSRRRDQPTGRGLGGGTLAHARGVCAMTVIVRALLDSPAGRPDAETEPLLEHLRSLAVIDEWKLLGPYAKNGEFLQVLATLTTNAGDVSAMLAWLCPQAHALSCDEFVWDRRQHGASPLRTLYWLHAERLT